MTDRSRGVRIATAADRLAAQADKPRAPGIVAAPDEVPVPPQENAKSPFATLVERLDALPEAHELCKRLGIPRDGPRFARWVEIGIRLACEQPEFTGQGVKKPKLGPPRPNGPRGRRKGSTKRTSEIGSTAVRQVLAEFEKAMADAPQPKTLPVPHDFIRRVVGMLPADYDVAARGTTLAALIEGAGGVAHVAHAFAMSPDEVQALIEEDAEFHAVIAIRRTYETTEWKKALKAVRAHDGHEAPESRVRALRRLNKRRTREHIAELLAGNRTKK